MIERKTIIDKLEIDRLNNVGVQFGLLLVEDDVEISKAYHRVALSPTADVAAELLEVNKHFEQTKQPPISQEDIQRISALHAFVAE